MYLQLSSGLDLFGASGPVRHQLRLSVFCSLIARVSYSNTTPFTHLHS
jgi:hypothetical protein